jgi:hypothetical protein
MKVQRGAVRQSGVRFRVCEFSVGSFHPKTRRRPIQARHNPVALFQRFQDLLTF